MISVSLVSHGQAELVSNLLDDLVRHRPLEIEVILTLNVEEPLPFEIGSYPFFLKLIRNTSPKGFAANHNAAFDFARGKFFCVLNPDVRLIEDPFQALVDELSDPRVGVVAPLIVGPNGDIEDSARRFPTPMALLRKVVRSDIQLDYIAPECPFSPDWIAGIFMLFRRDVFREIDGFDQRYFLYYEDAELCARLRLAGYDIRVNPGVRAVHNAQRRSHRDLVYLSWHMRSVLRFFLSKSYREIMRRQGGRG